MSRLDIPEFDHGLSKKEIRDLLCPPGELTDPPVVVEIGAHYGEDSYYFLETFEEIELYCFEPDPRNIEMIKKYLDTTRFTLIEKAVSNVDDKQVKFYLSYKENFDHIKMLHKYRWIDESDYLDKNLNRSGASSLKPGLDTVSEVCFVETITLDTWAKEANIEHIDFIWVDVQGAERSVIEGAEHMLQHTDYIFTEFGEDQYQDYLSREHTFHEFISRGFEVVPAHTSAGEKGNALFRRGDL